MQNRSNQKTLLIFQCVQTVRKKGKHPSRDPRLRNILKLEERILYSLLCVSKKVCHSYRDVFEIFETGCKLLLFSVLYCRYTNLCFTVVFYKYHFLRFDSS